MDSNPFDNILGNCCKFEMDHSKNSKWNENFESSAKNAPRKARCFLGKLNFHSIACDLSRWKIFQRNFSNCESAYFALFPFVDDRVRFVAIDYAR